MTFATQISVPSLQDGASVFRIPLYEAQIINKSRERPAQPHGPHVKRRRLHSVWPFSGCHGARPCRWPVTEQEPAPWLGPTGQTAGALQRPPFPPSHEVRTTCTDKEKRKLAKQGHLPCSLNVPEETFSETFSDASLQFWKEKAVPYTQARTCSHKPNFMLCRAHHCNAEVKPELQSVAPGYLTDLEL